MVLIHLDSGSPIPEHPRVLVLYCTELCTTAMINWLRLSSRIPQITFICVSTLQDPIIHLYIDGKLTDQYSSSTPIDQLEDICLLVTQDVYQPSCYLHL